jgi:hypothetical protein
MIASIESSCCIYFRDVVFQRSGGDGFLSVSLLSGFPY